MTEFKLTERRREMPQVHIEPLQKVVEHFDRECRPETIIESLGPVELLILLEKIFADNHDTNIELKHDLHGKCILQIHRPNRFSLEMTSINKQWSIDDEEIRFICSGIAATTNRQATASDYELVNEYNLINDDLNAVIQKSDCSHSVVVRRLINISGGTTMQNIYDSLREFINSMNLMALAFKANNRSSFM